MADIHVTRDLLWAVARGEVPASAVTQIGVQHLMSLCPTCRQELLAKRPGPPCRTACFALETITRLRRSRSATLNP